MENLVENLPPRFIDKWQGITDLLAKILDVPAALIMKTDNDYMEVFLSSKSEANPYHRGDKEQWDGLYCQTVIQTQRELLVANALKDQQWMSNPDIKLGMISYYGLPLNFPNGEPFGTICVLNQTENNYLEEHKQLIRQFRDVIELDLAIIHSLEITHNISQKELIDNLLGQNENLKREGSKSKALEQELTQSMEKYRMLAENISDVIWILQVAQKKFSYISPSVVHLTGFTVEEALQQRLEDALSPESVQAIAHDLAENISLFLKNPNVNQSFKHEIQQKCKDGQYRWIETVTQVQFSPRGELEVLGVSRSIEDRKKTERQLNESHQLLKNLTEQVPGVLFQYRRHPDGRRYFPYASDTIWDVYEVTHEDVKHDATKAFNRIHPDDREGVTNSILQSFDTLDVWTFEYRVVLPQKGIRWLHGQAKPEKLADGSVLWHGYINDITEKHAADKAFKDSQLRWQFALEGSKDGVWDWNLATNEVFFSPRWKAMLGFEETEIANSIEEWKTRVHPEDAEQCYAAIRKHLTGETETYANIHRLLCKNNTYLWILDRGIITERDIDGSPIRMIGTHTDLTERMEMESDLRRLNADKDIFIRMLGHDLRNPFNTLIGFSDLLLEHLPHYTLEEIEEQVQLINQTSKRTFDLLDQILIWAKSQSGQLTLTIETFDFKAICHEIIQSTEPQASRKNIRINVLDTAADNLSADINIVKTVLRNLVSNAVKYSLSNGSITLSAEVDQERCLIKVTDTGIGMNEESLARLWTVNSSYSTKGTNNEAGTGFGLQLCKALIDKHGGCIWAESEVGHGSTFFVSLPNQQP
jgi:PAS domain S-box-containing protein